MQRLFTVFVILVCSAFSLAAQEFTFTASSEKPSIGPSLRKKASPASTKVTIPGLRMRNTGRTLTLCGSLLFVGGVVMMNNADELYYTSTQTQYGTVNEGDPKGALGVLMAVGGAGMMVPGIIFWKKGLKKYNRYLERQTVSFKAGGSAVALRYSF
jgi:hypothetical protein